MAELRRDLGLLDAVGVGFGAIVGAGIFVVSGIAAGIAGPALLISLVIAAIAAACNALSSAQLAAQYPQSGGTYEYGYRLLHPWLGFVAGWMFLVSKLAAAGTVALGVAGYLYALVPEVSARLIAVGAIVIFTVLTSLGVRRSSRVNLVIVTVSVGTLLLFAALALRDFDSGALRPFAPNGSRGIMQAAAILFFAYTGYARIATLGEEVREPRRTIPRAIHITLVGAVVLYVLVAVAALGVVGARGLAATPAPLLAAAHATRASGWLPFVIAAGGVAAMLGVILSQILGLSRMALAMARRGDLPRGIARVSAGTGSPVHAIITVGAIAAVITWLGELAAVASAAAFAILVYYGIANAAALRLPASARLYPRIVPVVGLIACVTLAFSLPGATILSGILLLTAGIGFRLIGLAFRD